MKVDNISLLLTLYLVVTTYWLKQDLAGEWWQCLIIRQSWPSLQAHSTDIITFKPMHGLHFWLCLVKQTGAYVTPVVHHDEVKPTGSAVFDRIDGKPTDAKNLNWVWQLLRYLSCRRIMPTILQEVFSKPIGCSYSGQKFCIFKLDTERKFYTYARRTLLRLHPQLRSRLWATSPESWVTQ